MADQSIAHSDENNNDLQVSALRLRQAAQSNLEKAGGLGHADAQHTGQGQTHGRGASEVGNKIGQHADKAIFGEQVDNLYGLTSDGVYRADIKKGANCRGKNDDNTK